MAAVSTTAVSTRPASTRPEGTRPGGTRPHRPRAMVAVPACPEAIGPGPAARRVAGYDDRAPVAAAVALLLLLVLGSPLAGLVGGATTPAEGFSPSPPPAAAASSVHVAQPGDTYWSIAQRLGGPGDVRSTVDALMAANDERPLAAGDRIVVPLTQ